MKRILVIQDLSCVGRCSLTVALPILSAMGVNCSALPTAVLSTHTAFPDPHIHSLTEDIVPIGEHLSEIGAEFDAILVGYLSDPEQAEAVAELMSSFACPVILDPAMGDHGKLYKGITREHIAVMRDLAAMADVVLPNVTEAALLTGMPYREDADTGYLRELARKLLLGQPGWNITRIASACGFADYNYFIRAFRHHTGLTPLQYRKQMRKP